MVSESDSVPMSIFLGCCFRFRGPCQNDVAQNKILQGEELCTPEIFDFTDCVVAMLLGEESRKKSINVKRASLQVSELVGSIQSPLRVMYTIRNHINITRVVYQFKFQRAEPSTFIANARRIFETGLESSS